jgi:hypothetical protein
MQLEIDIAAEARDSTITSLNLDALTRGDLLNLILQRGGVSKSCWRDGLKRAAA